MNPSLQPAGAWDPPPGVHREEEEALSEEFRERVRLFAFRWVGATDSEDVAQETLRRVIRALRGGLIRNRTHPTAFIFQTARHVCMELRRTHARETRALERLEREGLHAPVLNPDPLRGPASDRSDLTALAMRHLSLEDQNLLRLFYVDGWGTAEVAAELGLSAATTRVRKHRALSRLRDEMVDDGVAREDA
jgi:RNA polymerase sigma-70 factor (ECF subfamily)